MLRAAILQFSDPTLLITGDIDDIARLAGAIAEKDFLVLRDSADCKLHGLREIAIKPSSALASFTLVEDGVLWQISEVERRRVVAALVGLMHSREPAHAYLDPEGNSSGIDVVGSIGEYDIDKIVRLREGHSESGVSLREQ